MLGRAEAAPARWRARRSGTPGVSPLRARGRGRRAAAPPEHRRAARRAAGFGLFVFELMAGRNAGRTARHRRAAHAGRGPAAGARPAGGAGRGARTRHRPPRRQTRQRLLRRRRQREARRFRRRAPRRLRPDPVGRLPGHAGVHVARADQQRADRRRGRLLRAGRDAVRGAHGPAAVPRPRSRRPAPGRGAAAAVVAAPGSRPAATIRRCGARSRRRRPIASARRSRWPRPWPPGRTNRCAAAATPPASSDGGDQSGGAAPAPPAIEEERELWHTADARLVVRRDTRTARHVLIEERAQPLEDTALERLRNIAAAGGPLVQRVLRLSDDRRAIWYEAIVGEAVPLDDALRRGTPSARRGDRVVAGGRGALRRTHIRRSRRTDRARAELTDLQHDTDVALRTAAPSPAAWKCAPRARAIAWHVGCCSIVTT